MAVTEAVGFAPSSFLLHCLHGFSPISCGFLRGGGMAGALNDVFASSMYAFRHVGEAFEAAHVRRREAASQPSIPPRVEPSSVSPSSSFSPPSPRRNSLLRTSSPGLFSRVPNSFFPFERDFIRFRTRFGSLSIASMDVDRVAGNRRITSCDTRRHLHVSHVAMASQGMPSMMVRGGRRREEGRGRRTDRKAAQNGRASERKGKGSPRMDVRGARG